MVALQGYLHLAHYKSPYLSLQWLSLYVLSLQNEGVTPLYRGRPLTTCGYKMGQVCGQHLAKYMAPMSHLELWPSRAFMVWADFLEPHALNFSSQFCS